MSRCSDYHFNKDDILLTMNSCSIKIDKLIGSNGDSSDTYIPPGIDIGWTGPQEIDVVDQQWVQLIDDDNSDDSIGSNTNFPNNHRGAYGDNPISNINNYTNNNLVSTLVYTPDQVSQLIINNEVCTINHSTLPINYKALKRVPVFHKSIYEDSYSSLLIIIRMQTKIQHGLSTSTKLEYEPYVSKVVRSDLRMDLTSISGTDWVDRIIYDG